MNLITIVIISVNHPYFIEFFSKFVNHFQHNLQRYFVVQQRKETSLENKNNIVTNTTEHLKESLEQIEIEKPALLQQTEEETKPTQLKAEKEVKVESKQEALKCVSVPLPPPIHDLLTQKRVLKAVNIKKRRDTLNCPKTAAKLDGITPYVEKIKEHFKIESKTFVLPKTKTIQKTNSKVLRIERRQNILIMLRKMPFFRKNDLSFQTKKLFECFMLIETDLLDELAWCNLQSICPGEDEITALKKVLRSELDSPLDIFLHRLANVPRAKQRAELVKFRIAFDGIWKNLVEQITELKNCLRIVTENVHFNTILKVMLEFANVLNEGTLMGNATGFHLADILKFQMITSDKSESLVKYIVSYMASNYSDMPSFVIQFLPLERVIYHISPKILNEKLQSIKNFHGELKEHVAIEKQPFDKFNEKMKPFVITVKTKMDFLNKMYQSFLKDFNEIICGEMDWQSFFKVLLEFRQIYSRAEREF